MQNHDRARTIVHERAVEIEDDDRRRRMRITVFTARQNLLEKIALRGRAETLVGHGSPAIPYLAKNALKMCYSARRWLRQIATITKSCRSLARRPPRRSRS